ncbi:MAG TPA: protein tyrosine phosphatase [Leucothrix mucor]|nr:protein tyrosine phosphatase [Leucothrix mucor]
MNLLFICSRNQWRSPTAENIYRQKGYNTRSVGTSSKSKRVVSVKDIQWADQTFVMEKKHKNMIIKKFGRSIANKNIIVLDIPDDYQYMDADLITHLEDVLAIYL